jgi:16S rRNA (uracil1498-N3)-methyltransferase
VHRCWLGESGPLAQGETVRLSPQESAHVARVLRMKAGEKVQLIAAENLYEGELVSPDPNAAQVRVLSVLPSPEPSVRITLVQGLPKLDKLEWIVQKATELGVWDILPVKMERSVAHADGDKKGERLNRIVLEAAKQSGRAHVPQVLAARDGKSALAYMKEAGFEAVFVAWEEEGALSLSNALQTLLLQNPKPKKIALVIGPEGGIDAKEIELFRSFGARCVTLGKRILRTETAGLCALAVTMSVFGEM